jgi:citrate lyase subunit beta/citryl-CoA lyase
MTMTSYSNGTRPMRSKLFVPGSKPALFPKATASGADCVCFDLEDAVSDESKHTARADIAAYLASAREHPAATMVRINAADSAYFLADIEAVVGADIDYINVPKVDTGQAALAACELIVATAARLGARQPGILANIETPQALGNAASIASAHGAIIGLQLGYGDLFLPFEIDRADEQALAYIRMTCKMAAAQAGIAIYDGAYFLKDDMDGFRQEAMAARRMGFAGKSCIVPAQVAHANSIFGPDSAEQAFAARVLEEYAMRSPDERGAFQIDGKMVDQVFVDWARMIVSRTAASK